MIYQIRVTGHLDQTWLNWFGNMTLTLENLELEDNGDTVLSCAVVDQAALYGLLKKVRDCGLPLISVIRTKPGQEAVPSNNQ